MTALQHYDSAEESEPPLLSESSDADERAGRDSAAADDAAAQLQQTKEEPETEDDAPSLPAQSSSIPKRLTNRRITTTSRSSRDTQTNKKKWDDNECKAWINFIWQFSEPAGGRTKIIEAAPEGGFKFFSACTGMCSEKMASLVIWRMHWKASGKSTDTHWSLIEKS